MGVNGSSSRGTVGKRRAYYPSGPWIDSDGKPLIRTSSLLEVSTSLRLPDSSLPKEGGSGPGALRQPYLGGDL